MRTGAARGRAGHFHEAGFYGSDIEFRALVVPFAEEGIAAGEPVIIGYDDRKNAMVRSWLTDPSAVTFLADKGLYATPARAIATYRRLFEWHAAMGARQIRITGELPHSGNGGSFEGWDRYEAAVNTVWEDFPVWGLCLYDTATAPAAVLDVAERTHPRIVSPSGAHRANDRFEDAAVFEGLPFASDPLEQTRPMIELVDGSAAEARQALAQIGRYCARDRGGVGNVDHGGVNAAIAVAFTLQCRAGLVERRCIDIPQHHRGARRQQALRDGKADALGGTRNQRAQSRQIDLHAKTRLT